MAVVEVKRALAKIEKGVADLGKPDRPPQQEQSLKTFAQVASTPKPSNQTKGPNHTLIISSTDPQHTGDNVIERIREALDLKTTGARVDAVRKARNQKVVLRCASKADLGLVRDQFKSNKGLRVQEPKPQNSLVCLKGVLSSYSDQEIADLLMAQNKHLLQKIAVGEQTIKMRYRKRARNPHECHPVLELSSKLWQCFTQAQKVHSPLEGIKLNCESWLTEPRRAWQAAYIAQKYRYNVVLDAFCGAGGNTIQFAMACNRVGTATQRGYGLPESAMGRPVVFKSKWTLKFYSDLQPCPATHLPRRRRRRIDPLERFLDLCNSLHNFKLVIAEYDIEIMLEPRPASELMRVARTISCNVEIFLPRNSRPDQILALAEKKVEVEKNYIGKGLVAITAYYF
ncbi:unnamed protein product [Spodoptera littoralis]|uniref:Trimethylguanosine synthase n=1 Tax=Spodoptera littoralis TaxID=7109 RepID=A0A9P0I0G8_SPOLI|nr:unnamed protein product [Spodoptera littoralis]CAH1638861.1 unnamed protein product [Spodoptera littoralis]